MKIFSLLLLTILLPVFGFSQLKFDDYFEDGVLRFDYYLSGTNTLTNLTEAQIKKEPQWGGVHEIRIQKEIFGNYYFTVKDNVSKEVLYQQGFSTLFQEWQSTAEAKIKTKAFYQVIRFPFPKSKVLLEIKSRQRDGTFESIYSTLIDPSDYMILHEKPVHYKQVMLKNSGDPSKKVDVLLLAEGYKQEEMGKFVKDATRLVDSLFKVEPFASSIDQFNITALQTPSLESGTDIPGRRIYSNTLFNSTFYTFNIARYLTISDLKTIHDYAAEVPYDFLIVLVNTTEYGGGGFYNFLSVCTSDHYLSPKVFIHEFGHEFAGLGDEYYTSEVAYLDYYNLKIEPWEPNLTTLVDFKSKWSSMVDSDTPVPTPRIEKYENKTGVFEGGGYLSKGIYSPMQDCRMKSNKPNSFCPVCQQAIRKVILNYTK